MQRGGAPDVDEGLFPATIGNQVVLYSNAYDESGDHAHGVLADMFRDLNAATHHICIVGWALSSTEKFGDLDHTLPELLVRKAREGVKVTVLVWDNIVPVYSREHKKLMQAVEHEIANLHKWEQVVVRDCLHIKFSPRELGYTDHQKMVVVDDALYIGGLDLVGDRSDPDVWHDSHARIEGAAVSHAVSLIHARWDGVMHDAQNHHTGSQQLASVSRWLYEYMQERQQVDMNPNKKMQLLCSVREEFWGKQHKWCAVPGGDKRTQEIQDAHLAAIQRAQRFIYMENQFFIGNRVHKNQKDTVQSSNQVIEAIVNKIIQKIMNGEDFHFYCQLPYRPEGKANAIDVRVILRKQWRTMEWVIKAVDQVARQYGKTAQDYITFYNLGRRAGDDYQMKYTHSKLMIVDDHEMILGSANCNERSMAGNRDSEAAISMIGYDMEIANYRERLMCEHFGEEFVNANAKLLLQFPERKESHDLLQHHLDDNLSRLVDQKHPIATPWGNVTNEQLMHRVRPPHVMRRSPLPFSVVMGAVKWAGKLPL